MPDFSAICVYSSTKSMETFIICAFAYVQAGNYYIRFVDGRLRVHVFLYHRSRLIQNTISRRPVLVLADGYKSWYTYSLIPYLPPKREDRATCTSIASSQLQLGYRNKGTFGLPNVRNTKVRPSFLAQLKFNALLASETIHVRRLTSRPLRNFFFIPVMINLNCRVTTPFF